MGTDRQTGREWAGWLPGRYAGFGSAVFERALLRLQLRHQDQCVSAVPYKP